MSGKVAARLGLRVSGWIAAAAVLAACATGGPVKFVGPERFSGVGDLLTSQKALNVFVVHGMRAEQERFRDGFKGDCVLGASNTPAVGDDVRRQVLERVAPKDPRDYRPLLRCRIMLLDDDPPNVTLGGQPVWTKAEWAKARPFVEISDHRLSGDRALTFYAFDYWPMLVSLKCKHLVGPDQQLVGSTKESEYCAKYYDLAPKPHLSNRPLPVNSGGKEGLVVWGIADAVLVTSELGKEMQRALREAMTIQLAYAAIIRPNLNVASVNRIDIFGAASIQRLEASGVSFNSAASVLGSAPLKDQSWALIAESLGSYLSLATLKDGLAIKIDAKMQHIAEAVVCGANQIHMLANQVAILRLSEFGAASTSGGAFATACAASDVKPKQVVAYHDPNDLLTYLLPPKEAGDSTAYTDVIAPFAPVIIPFVVANPIEAHSGQIRDKRIMDMVVSGTD